jgi:hypothetical protein
MWKRLLRDPAIDLALALDHDGALQPRPVMAFLQPLYIVDRHRLLRASLLPEPKLL